MVSEYLFRFLLAEIETVRLRCVKCQKFIEVGLESLAAVLNPKGDKGVTCRFCGNALVTGDEDPFALLQRALLKFRENKDNGEISFTVPVTKQNRGE
jgi:hypothetical protein